MTWRTLAGSFVLAGLLVLAGPGMVAAQSGGNDPSDPLKIGVIDMQKIMRESAAVQSIQKQIEAQRSQYQEQLSEKEQKLRSADEELARQRRVLSEEALQKKRRKMEEEVGSLQHQIRTSKRALDKKYSRAMRKVQQKLVEIVSDIASTRDLDLVIGKATVVLVRPELDITSLALERLNATMSSVEVPPLEQQN